MRKGSFSDLCKGRTKSSPAKSTQLCLITQEPNKNTIAFLESLKKALQSLPIWT